MKDSSRVRINLTVDREILELVKKWSYISGLSISALFDRVFERETRRFKYESDEAWEASDECREFIDELDPHYLFNKPIFDANPKCMPNFNFTDAEYESVGIQKNEEGIVELSAKFPGNGKRLEKLYIRKLRGDDYYKRWEEVCRKKK